MSGLIRCRKFVSRLLVRLDEPFTQGSRSSAFNLAYFVIGRFAAIGVWSVLFLLEIPLHLFRHASEGFSSAAIRGPGLDYQESYSSFLRRQRLAVASILTSFIVLVAQLTYLGYTVVQFTVPAKTDAQSISVDISPTWDNNAQRLDYWGDENPCATVFTDYSTQGAAATTMTFGKDSANPTNCVVQLDYLTKKNRPVMKFSLTSIPNNATITGVSVLTNVSDASSQLLTIVRPTSDSVDTLSGTDGTLYNAIGGGTSYGTATWSTTGAKNVALNATAVTDVQSRITGSDIIGIGIYTSEGAAESINGAIASQDNATPANRPILRVTYTIPPVAPSSPGHSSNATTSITWTWTDNATGETRYDVRDGSGNVAGCTNLAANTTSCTETGLSANTTYTRSVRVTDADGTADSTSAAAYSSIETPSGISFNSVTGTTMSVAAAGTFSNLANGSSGLYFEETTAPQNSGWLQTNSYGLIGLDPNTPYSFRVKGRNSDGDETPFTSTANKYTLALSPSVTASRTASTWYTTNGFNYTSDVAWGAGGVQYYRYAWTQNAVYSFTGTESIWSDLNEKCPGGTCTDAGTTLTKNATVDGNNWYLHLQSLNSDNVANGTIALGPYYFDGTGPSAPTTVNDGPGPDISTQTLTTSLSANWSAVSDTGSGLAKYQYAVGTTGGGTNVVNYTDHGTATSVTVNRLSLAVGSTYYVSVRAVDAVGNTGSVSTSNGVTITAAIEPTPPDTAGPVITDISTDATSTTATIRWVTNEPATAVVEYGIAATYGTQVNRPTLATEHQLALTGLSPDTTYHFRLTSADERANVTSTTDDTFTTASVVSQGVTGPTLLRPVVRDGDNPSITITGVGKGNQTITLYVNDRAVKSVHLEGALTQTKSFAVKLLANIRPTGKYTVTATATQSDGRLSEVRQRLTFRIKAEVASEKYIQPSVVSTYIVHAGDSLWRIAARMLGDGNRWREIVDANVAHRPSLTASTTVSVGWDLTIPAS